MRTTPTGGLPVTGDKVIMMANLPTAWEAPNGSGPLSDNCVVLQLLEGGNIAVGDTKNTQGPALVFTPAELRTFLESAKTGQYDGLCA